jgi:O-antigen/teichoic acid export membrane protein
MPYAGLAALSMLLISFPADLARGLQKFLLWGGIQIGSNILRLGFLGLLLLGALVTPKSSLLIFALAPLAVFFVSWLWLDRGILKSSVSRDQVSHFWSFNKWTAAFIISSAVTSRLDTFVSARYLSLEQLGIYGLATTMATFMPQLSGAFGAVTSAKFASFNDPAHAARYLKKAVLFTSALSIAAAIAMVPVALFVVWFTGGAYTASLPPFFILLVTLVLFTSLSPLRDSLFYFHARPDLFFWASLAQSAIIVGVGSWLIPGLGVIGSALTVLVSLVFLSVAMVVYYLRLTKASLA